MIMELHYFRNTVLCEIREKHFQNQLQPVIAHNSIKKKILDGGGRIKTAL